MGRRARLDAHAYRRLKTRRWWATLRPPLDRRLPSSHGSDQNGDQGLNRLVGPREGPSWTAV
jgi:hypothetical protein